MRWRDYRQSDNVEDRRGMRAGGGGIAIGGGGLLLILALAVVTGQNPLELLDAVTGGGGQVSIDGGGAPQQGAPSDDVGQFASTVLASTEDVWSKVLQGYRAPRLVLFSGAVQSACGTASSAVGPFYCPLDSQVYLDLSFFKELERRFGAPGDFAQAYVIAHEIGHHVQNQMGIAEKVTNARQRASQEEANALSVRMELQADCLAGVWGYYANRDSKLLDPGDIEEGLRAAQAIGDDTLQKQSQGYSVPESWTHGSSAQRQQWLKRGLASGNVNDCDTFAQ